jgi:hypothetical protein
MPSASLRETAMTSLVASRSSPADLEWRDFKLEVTISCGDTFFS